MKRLVALLLAVLSGCYLLVMGPTPDPLPFIDEGVAGLVFLLALKVLGVNPRKVLGWRESVSARHAKVSRGGKQGP